MALKKIGNIGLDPEVYDRLKWAAQVGGRTLTQEIKLALTAAAFKDSAPIPDSPLGSQTVVKIVHPCPECCQPVKVVHAQLWRCPSCGASGTDSGALTTDRLVTLE